MFSCAPMLPVRDTLVKAYLKRKADSNVQSPSPKSIRLEACNRIGEEDYKEEFNTYQYWKTPLPDISSELGTIATPMSCD